MLETIPQTVGFIFLSLFVIILVFTQRNVRRWFFKKHLTKSWQLYEKYLHLMYLFHFIFMFCLPSAIALLIITVDVFWEHFLTLLILGFTLVAFASVELPLLTKPDVFITLYSHEEKSYRRDRFHACIRSGKPKVLTFKIANMGLHLLKNCRVTFYFHGGIEAVDDPELYAKVGYKKKFSIHGKHTIQFFPVNNYLSLPPQDVALFPICIKATIKGDTDVDVAVDSESAWGTSLAKIPISVV